MGLCFSSPNEIQHHHKPSTNAKGGNSWTTPASNQSRTTSASKSEKQGNKSPGVLFAPKGVKELRLNSGYSNVDIFTFEEMKLTRKHFRPGHIIGEGGFGVVYRGILAYSVRAGYKSIEVAIKQLNPNGFQGEKEWLTEVSYMGQLNHPNLVRLIGYCCEDEQRLLVYEYMASGCVAKHLFCRISCELTWSRRIKIAIDAAKGLAFLHGQERQIIYRDFKTSNILLDSEDGHLTRADPVENSLVEWCHPLLNNNKKLLRILDTRIDGQYSIKAMMRVADLGYKCLSQNPKGRPMMSEVVEILETVNEQERTEEMGIFAQNGVVTLYKALKENPENPIKNEDDRSTATTVRHRKRGVRSKSEPQNDLNIFSPALDVRGHNRSCRDDNAF